MTEEDRVRILGELGDMRALMRVSREELGRRVGIGGSTVRGSFNGKRNPRERSLGRLAGGLGFDLEVFEGRYRLIWRGGV